MSIRHMSDVMHRRQPITLRGTDTVQRACQAMHVERIGAVLVTDAQGGLEGIFTGRDAVRLLAEGHNPAHTRLDAVMTRNPTALAPHRTAMEALRVMRDGGFRHVPVVHEGRVIGIVSHGDFRALEHTVLDEQSTLWERM